MPSARGSKRVCGEFDGRIAQSYRKTRGGWLRNVLGGYNKKQLAYYKKLIDEAEKSLEQIAAERRALIYPLRRKSWCLRTRLLQKSNLRAQYIITYKPKKRAAVESTGACACLSRRAFLRLRRVMVYIGRT